MLVHPHYKAPEGVESQLKAAHLANPTFDFQPPLHAHQQTTVELHPGDLFYFPAEMWHRVKTGVTNNATNSGVSISISLMATNYATLTCQALQHLLLKRAPWRD